jgi:hypothetical protein
MKRLQKAISDFQQSQDNLMRAQQRRVHSPRLRRYSEIQRRESCHEATLPCLATHYEPQLPAHPGSMTSIRHHIGCLANQDNGNLVTFLHHSSMFIIDTGASISISNDKSDFTTPLRPVQPTVLHGIASGLHVKGIGTATHQFFVPDAAPIVVTLHNVLYVPECTIRLLCPRCMAVCTGISGDGFNTLQDHGVLMCRGAAIKIPYHDATGLPIIFGTAVTQSSSITTSLSALPAAIKQPPVHLQGPP